MALSDKEKQLLALEEELGLVPRRKLKTKIDVMQSDLKHAIQMARISPGGHTSALQLPLQYSQSICW